MANSPPPVDSPSEQQRLLAELTALGRHDKIRVDRLAELEARIQKSIDDDAKQLADKLAEIERTRPPAPTPPSPQWFLMGLGIFSSVGSLLELTLGQSFIFAFAGPYWAMAPGLFVAVLVLCLGLFLRDGARQNLRARYRSWAKRWLLMVPLSASFLAGLTVLAMPGWAALFGWIAGGSVTEHEARIVWVGSFSKSAKSCDQRADFRINDSVVGLCLEGRMAGPAPAVGETVLLVGRNSWFGLSVSNIRRR